MLEAGISLFSELAPEDPAAAHRVLAALALGTGLLGHSPTPGAAAESGAVGAQAFARV